MGLQLAPPDQILDSNGRASGPAVEVVREAARRTGVKIDWVYSPEGPEAALESGKVDLWPLFGDLPDRRGRFYLSKRWCLRRFWLLTPSSSGVKRFEDTAGKTVAVVYPGTQERVARLFLPQPRTLRRNSTSEVVWRQFARGRPWEAWSGLGSSCRLPAKIPKCATSARLAQWCTPASAPHCSAPTLPEPPREGITSLSRDGTLSGIFFASSGPSSNDATKLECPYATRVSR
jgi:hypothetical protein